MEAIGKVAVLSRSDSSGGGAGRVAEELSHELRARGIGVHHWMRSCKDGFDGVTRFSLQGRHPRLWAHVHKLALRAGYPELLPLELMTLRQHVQDYDLFHFHDLSGAISPYTLRYIAGRKPVLWTFHDCSPFTAGCLYPMGCERYKTGCGACPQLDRWPLGCRFDGTARMHGIKKTLHGGGRIVPVAPSEWMADMAMSSGMFKTRPKVIPNGVDVNLFCPRDKAAFKAYLGIRKDRPVVSVIAHSLKDERKGVAYAIDALRSISDMRPFVLLIGGGGADMEARLAGLDHISIGYVGLKSQMAFWHAAADVFLFPSLADNMPLAVLEAMSCGVPTVGFKTGGMVEMVQQDLTGCLVEQGDALALSEVLRRAIHSGSLAEWGCAARRRAVENYSMERFVSAHVSLYETIRTAK